MFLILIIFTILRADFSHETIAEIVFYVSVIFYFASPLFGKVELRQHGILEYIFTPPLGRRLLIPMDRSGREQPHGKY